MGHMIIEDIFIGKFSSGFLKMVALMKVLSSFSRVKSSLTFCEMEDSTLVLIQGTYCVPFREYMKYYFK